MEIIKKYQNQVVAVLQLLICAAGVILAIRSGKSGQKKAGRKQKA